MAIKYLHKNNYSDVCEYVSRIIEEQLLIKPNSNIAMNANDDLIGIYGQIVNDIKKGKYNFNKVNFFLTEELANVTRNNANSVFSYMDKNIFTPINMPLEQVFYPQTFAPKRDEEYDPVIFKKNSLDLAIIFLGKGGELGYIEQFKNFKSDYTSKFWLRENSLASFKIMQKNKNLNSLELYSIGSGALFNTKKIIVIALGLGRSSVVYKIMNAKIMDNKFAATLLMEHPDVTLVTDITAGALLPKSIQ
ncbi:glucosamine-6-phosphate deaminase [Mycoplasmopsis caviae]|uniref:Glucosamine-6-phosphate deaminase n=1 Tax=Mycoplasmopsis caviae TaxID=55603 RepID=A0A3P8MEV9_9BACT|nr:glucosamine-6-phosphate deaminase [Mycoplasmopsis caviae]UUD35747.1 glucosamine-6-phosphate deaminase [Mycoplasmopsis caviae]VDR42396.1 Glucosamine-6-phosphate deaminase 1 [Mycoplasmopsis caviae]